MKKKQVRKVPFPTIDGQATSGSYLTKNSRKDPKTLITKEEMKEFFIARFGYEPEEIFFGKPNGSLIYAGPVREEREYPELSVFDKPITQQELFGDIK